MYMAACVFPLLTPVEYCATLGVTIPHAAAMNGAVSYV
jgi:hypothetical protein